MNDPKLLVGKSIICHRAICKFYVASIAFDANHLNFTTGASRSNASVIEPAPPSAPEFDNAEFITCYIHGAEGCCPFSNIRVPVCWDGDGLDLPCFSIKNAGKEIGSYPYAKEIREVPLRGG